MRMSEEQAAEYLARRAKEKGWVKAPHVVGVANAGDKPMTGRMIDLPWPPSGNHIYRAGENGMRRLTDRAKAYRLAVRNVCMALRVGAPYTGRLAVAITLYCPDRRARDIDNPVKAILDALQSGGIYENDSQIDDLHVMRAAGSYRGGSVVVRVTQISP
jgi:crossover junction endodeoxyribonuclease RusA